MGGSGLGWSLLALYPVWGPRCGLAATIPFLVYVCLIAVLWGLLWRAAIAARLTEPSLRHVWVVAVTFRLIGVFAAPFFEDDFYRYLWDGHLVALGLNPYRSRPLDWFGQPDLGPAWDQVLTGINYPHLATLYGPAAQAAFWLAHQLEPGSITAWKAVAATFDLGTMALLQRRIPARQLLVYALCPLLVQEIAFNGHLESVLVFGTVAAWRAVESRRVGLAGAFLGAAAAVKISAGFLVPLLLAGGDWRRAAKGTLAAFLVWSTAWLPFLADGGWPETSLGAFLAHWEFNSSLYALAAAALPPAGARLLLAAAFLAGAATIIRRCWRRASAIPALGLGLSAVALLVSPVVNPWYLVMLVPFAAARPSVTAWTAMGVVALSYATGLNLPSASLGPYDHPAWVRPVEYGVIAAVAAWEAWA